MSATHGHTKTCLTFGARLKTYYDGILVEPLPGHFQTLLERLEAVSSGDDEKDQDGAPLKAPLRAPLKDFPGRS